MRFPARKYLLSQNPLVQVSVILLLGCCFRVSLIAGYATTSAPISAIRIKTMASGGGMFVANVELESA